MFSLFGLSPLLGRLGAHAAVLDLLLAVAGLLLHVLLLLDLWVLAVSDRLGCRGCGHVVHIIHAVGKDVLERQFKVVAHALDSREVLSPGRLLCACVGEG